MDNLYKTTRIERLGIKLAIILIMAAKRMVVFRKTHELLQTAITTELFYMDKGK